MRLGGPVLRECETQDKWITAVQELGYRATYCPVGRDVGLKTIKAYADVAADADIVIAEVGAWSNPISKDSAARAEALDKCKKSLALADEIGARCCVNVSGSRGEKTCVFAHSGYEVHVVEPDNTRREQVKRADIASVYTSTLIDGVRMVRKGGEVVLLGVFWKRKTELFAHELLSEVFHRYTVLRSDWEWKLPLHEK